MMTSTGRLVTQDSGSPSIRDISIGLSRIQRFGAQGRSPWSVLQHSLLCADMAEQDGVPFRYRYFALMHDAHESVTGDIPTTLKTPDMSALQDRIDLRIWNDLLVTPPTPSEKRYVKLLDRRALLVEGVHVGPAGWPVELYGVPSRHDTECFEWVSLYTTDPATPVWQTFERAEKYLRERTT